MLRNSLPFILLIGVASFCMQAFVIQPSTALSDQKSPKWIQGEWTGIAYQIDGQVWDVSLVCDSNNGLIVDYPSLGCGGEWQIKNATKNRLDIGEKITSGVDKCDQDVQVVALKIDDNYISITYFLPSFKKGPIAYTVLEKKDID